MREHVCCEHVVASIWVPHALARSDLLRTVPTIFVFEFRMDLGIGWTLNASGCISGRAQSINKYLIYILGWRLMVAKVAGYVAIASVPPRHDAISARETRPSAHRACPHQHHRPRRPDIHHPVVASLANHTPARRRNCQVERAVGLVRWVGGQDGGLVGQGLYRRARRPAPPATRLPEALRANEHITHEDTQRSRE